MTTSQITESRSRENRSITVRYALDDTERTDSYGEIVRFALELTTYHDRDRKRYYSTARRIQVGPMFVRMSLLGEPQPPLGAQIVPAARYSAAALESAHRAFESAAADPETFAALIAWAANQQHDN